MDGRAVVTAEKAIADAAGHRSGSRWGPGTGAPVNPVAVT